MNLSASDPSTAPAVDPQNPWLGLASFTEDTRAYFHGREEEIGELCRRVQRKLLTVLFGQSGLGKTSILRAGLVPRLRPEGYCPVYVRVDYGPDSPPPSEQIKRAILRATETAGHWTRPGVADRNESLWEFLHHRDDLLRDATGRTLVPLLIFDQFEEIFTLAQGDDRGRRRAAEFMEELSDLVENRPPRALEARLEQDEGGVEQFDFTRSDYRILIALREDYLAHLEGLKARMPSVTQNRMRLARMTGTQALAAVVGPGRGLVSSEVAAAIVRFVSGGGDLEHAEVEPSLLSLVCRELNNTRLAQRRTEISADLLAGSRDTILSEFYERALADQPPGVRAFIEDELLTDSGYRESIAEERVRKGFAAAGAPVEALNQLVDRRLLRVEERLDLRRVELTHDVLCGIVRASRDVRQEREARAAEERRRQETEAQLTAVRAQEQAARRSAVRARMVAAACVVLAAGAAGTATWGIINLRRAEAAEARVAAERDRAQQSRGEAEKLVSFLLDDLYTQLEPTGKIEVVSGLAKRALAYFDTLPAEMKDARSERYRAMALSRYGLALSQQGKTLEAEEPLRQAEELYAKLEQEGDRSLETVIGHAAVLRQQSRNAYLQNRVAPGVELAKRSVALAMTSAAKADAPPWARIELGRDYLNRGFLLLRDRQLDEAMSSLRQATEIFAALRADESERQRASVLFAETCAWVHETARNLGRLPDVAALIEQGLLLADEAVAREAGNLGALRSRALLRSRLTQSALDANDHVTAERSSRQTTEDWTEFLRFDPSNDTARNNRRVSRGFTSQSLWRQGKLDAAITMARENTKELIALGGSPSTMLATAFGSEVYDNLEADLGNVGDADAALRDSVALRAMAASQVEPESYFRMVMPLWNETQRAAVLLRMGRTDEALAAATAADRKLVQLKPTSGAERLSQRTLLQNNNRVQTLGFLRQRRWSDAAEAALDLVRGRPEADDTSPGALDALATDRALAAVALARAGKRSEAERFVVEAGKQSRARRAAGATDHASRYQYALVCLAEALIAPTAELRREHLQTGLADLAALSEQPQQLRSIRELRDVMTSELTGAQ
jgi:tetratricopeptide (TPR) repeat protein